MTPNQVESGLKGMGINLPNSITGEKAAVPQSANPTTVSRRTLHASSYSEPPSSQASAYKGLMLVLVCRAMW